MVSKLYIASSFYPIHNIDSRAVTDEVVQRAEVLATKPDYLSSIPPRWRKPSLIAVL